MESEKQQRTRLAAGMLARHFKENGEAKVTLCPIEDVQRRVKSMSADERAELTAEVDWLVNYEAAEFAEWS